MSDNQVIPEAAVEAAAKVVVEEGAYGVPWGDASDSDREDALKKARDYLEAAAPHMLAEAWEAGGRAAVGTHDTGYPSRNPYRPAP